MNILNKTNTEKVTDLTTLLELEQLFTQRQSEIYKKYESIFDDESRLGFILTGLQTEMYYITSSLEIYGLKALIEKANQLILKQEKEVYEYGLELEARIKKVV